MKLQNTPELGFLNGYMKAMSCCLDGCNYVIWFNAKGIELDDGDLTPQTLDKLTYPPATPDNELQRAILLAYPKAKPELATMCECHHGLTMLTNTINTFIGRINPSDRFRNVRKDKKENLIIGFWHGVSQYIDYENSRIFQYNPTFGVDDELWDFIIWGFTFLIVNEQQRLALLIHCGASD